MAAWPPVSQTYHSWYTSVVGSAPHESREPDLRMVFCRSGAGREPVREWLTDPERDERKAIGKDIKTAQYGWPLGMPLICKLDPGIWEIRSSLAAGIARVVFAVDGDTMVLLHAFLKKSRKTPVNDIETSRRRLARLLEEAR
jgi:phage-related protein